MRQISPRLLCLALPCLAIFVLTACGHGSPTATPYIQRTAPASYAPAASAAAASSAAASAAGRPPGISGGPSTAPAASAAPSGGGQEQGPVDNALAAEQGRLLIKTGTFSLVVKDVDSFFDRLK